MPVYDCGDPDCMPCKTAFRDNPFVKPEPVAAHWVDRVVAGLEEPARSEKHETLTEAALCSLAISMKRIADEICTVPTKIGLVHMLSLIEEKL